MSLYGPDQPSCDFFYIITLTLLLLCCVASWALWLVRGANNCYHLSLCNSAIFCSLDSLVINSAQSSLIAPFPPRFPRYAYIKTQVHEWPSLLSLSHLLFGSSSLFSSINSIWRYAASICIHHAGLDLILVAIKKFPFFLFFSPPICVKILSGLALVSLFSSLYRSAIE